MVTNLRSTVYIYFIYYIIELPRSIVYATEYNNSFRKLKFLPCDDNATSSVSKIPIYKVVVSRWIFDRPSFHFEQEATEKWEGKERKGKGKKKTKRWSTEAWEKARRRVRNVMCAKRTKTKCVQKRFSISSTNDRLLCWEALGHGSWTVTEPRA